LQGSMKRSLDDNETVVDGIKKIRADGTEVKTDDAMEIRVLIDNYEASVVIGRGGTNVKNIRTESGSFVSILKNESPISKERVMTIKGSEDAISKAVQLIATLLLDSSNQRKLTDPKGAGEPEAQYTIKVLIHKFLAGSIIGKGGIIIKEIQEATAARMSLSVEPLAGSTEKTVSLTGTPECLYQCAVRVLAQLNGNPLRPGSTTILYVPGAGLMAAAAPYGAPPAFNPYGAQQQQPSPYGAPNPYGAPPQQQQQQQQQPSPYGQQPYGAPAPAAQGAAKTEKIVIPTVCAGTVIGKGGTIIRDIKNQSATVITIADAEPTAPADRVVSVTGSHQGIQTAIYLIRQRVESYQPPTAM
jgi:heterogeneous nuclear rnp K-like protein 2